MSKAADPLTTDELLVILMEECAEVIKAIYAIEHKREGEWRLHIGMEVALERTTLEVLDMPKLRNEWPDAEWRIAKYIPAPPEDKDNG